MAYIPGMPSGDYDKYKKQKEEEKKKKNEGSSSSKSTVPGLPSDVAEREDVQKRAQEQYDQQQANKSQGFNTDFLSNYRSDAEKKKAAVQAQSQYYGNVLGQNNAPAYNQGMTSGQIAAQKFISNLPTEASFINFRVGADASKILNNTEIIKKNSNMQNLTFQQVVDNNLHGTQADRLPTSERKKIRERGSSTAKISPSTTIEKGVLKSYRATEPSETTFEDMKDRVNIDRKPIACKYATAIDWTRMNKEGYRTVLIEYGGGDLQSKDGIYTIGRDRLADIPSGCKTVMIDKNNNWYYVANSTDAANFVKTMEDERAAKCGDILDKYDTYSKKAKAASDRLVLLHSLADDAANKLSINRTDENKAIYEKYLAESNKAYADLVSSKSVAGAFIRDYAKTYSKYDDAISEKQGWTVSDEIRYQELKSQLAFLSKERRYAGGNYVDISSSALPSSVREQMIKNAISGKSTDAQSEAALKDYMAKSFNRGDEEYSTEYAMLFSAYAELSKRRMELGDMPVYMDLDAIKKMEDNTANMQKAVDQYNKWDSVMLHMEDGEGVGRRLKTVALELSDGNTFLSKEGIKKLIDDWSMAGDSALKALGMGGKDALEEGYAEYLRTGSFSDAFQTYWNNGMIGMTFDEMNKAQTALTAGDISYAEYIKQEKYISNQLKSTMFNNVVTNMDVFDLDSIQREYVAMQMALHPELYSNDPKYKKLKEACERIYGTDYRGTMHAWQAAYAVFQMDKGAIDDYVYLDSSDLRHSFSVPMLWKEGENYGFVSSMLVGTLTSLSTLVSLTTKAAAATATMTKVGAKSIDALTDAATDVLTYSLKTSASNITDAEARNIATRYAKELRGASKLAIWKAFNNGDDLVETYVNLQSKRFARALGSDTEAIIKGLTDSEKLAFYRTSKTLLENISYDVVDRSFLLSKATVVTSALHDAAEAVNDFQMTLFKTSCPAVGAVTGMAKIYKSTQALIEKHITKEFMDDATKFMTTTEKQALAEITKMKFDDIYDAGLVKSRMTNIRAAFAEAALTTNDKFKAIADSIMAGVSENTMRMAANNYTNYIIGTLMDKLVVEDGAYTLKELEKFAMRSGFDSFDNMWGVIKNNLVDTMTEYSTDALAIVQSFEAEYTHAVNISKLNKYVDAESVYNTHMDAIKNFLGDPTNSLLSTVGTIESPMLLQGAALDLADSIYSFVYSMNPEWAAFKLADGTNSVIHVAAQEAMDALDIIATGNFGAPEIRAAQDALQQYSYQLTSVYYVNLVDAYSNAMYDALGHTGYLDSVRQNVAQTIPQDDSVTKEIAKQMSDRIKGMGYTVSADDIYNNVFVDKKALKDRNIQQLDTIYRVMRDKGSNTIAQIHDAHFQELTKAISNPDNPANKTLVMYANELERKALSGEAPELLERARNVRTAISNSSAVETTRAFSDTIFTGDISPVLYTGIMDSWTGNAGRINSILNSCSYDDAVTKITNLLVDDTQRQLSLHYGSYPNLMEYGANTVDATHNVQVLDEILTKNGFVSDEKHMDICFSIISTTDSGAPKDIAFYVRNPDGSKSVPFTLRQDLPFDITDSSFSAKRYGCSPENARIAYDNMGYHKTLSRDEFQQQLRDFIIEQKEIALADNKAIRFIGFNSADGVTDGNKYLNDVIRSTGTSINTANAIDFADMLRSKMGEYIIDGDTVANIRAGVSKSIRKAQTNSIILGMSPTIAYDSKFTCAEILQDVTENIPSGLSGFTEGLEYIKDLTQNVKGQLGMKAFETMGTSLGMLIDSQALERLLIDAGAAPQRMQQLIMSSVRDVLGNNSIDQIALHKIFDQSFVGTWFNVDNIKKVYGDIDDHLDYLHTQAQRINNIHNSIKRTDLITDTTTLKGAYNIMLEHLPYNNRLCQVARSLNVDALAPTELYAASAWLYDEIAKVAQPSELSDLKSLLLIADDNFLQDGMCSAILPEGRAVICGTLIDHTDDLLDPLAVRYLDTSEAGYHMAQQLDEINKHRGMFGNIKNYKDTQEAMFSMSGIHGEQDKLLSIQSAAVYDPILHYQKKLEDVYNTAYMQAIEKLPEGFDATLAHKYATQKAVAAYNSEVKAFGNNSRKAAVSAVLNLDEAGMKAHLIRNCGGGLVIDPAARCMEDVDLLPVIQRWRDDFGLVVEEFKYSGGNIQERTLYRVINPEVYTVPADKLFAKYNHARIDFSNIFTDSFSNMRNASFKASDMTLMNGSHMNAIKEQFFGGQYLLDIDKRFKDWSDELYMCNMWTDSDLKQIINPYYTDDPVRSLAQSTHQVRKNIEALHDLGNVMNNPRMVTRNILDNIGYDTAHMNKKLLKTIKKDLKDNGYKMCRIVQEGKKFKLVDFTDVITMKNYDTVLSNTICIDNGMYRILSEWNKATSMAVTFAGSNGFYKKLAQAYKWYKDTIRSHQITWYLYGNIGTAVRNMVDSSTKALNETIQYGESPMELVRNYVRAISDANEYSNIYREIMLNNGTVDHEAILKYFGDNEEGMRKFNLLYGYCQTAGADDLVEVTHEMAVKDNLKYLKEDAPYGDDVADMIRKEFDAVYASPKYRTMNTAQRADHMQAIHDKCMKNISAKLDGASDELLNTISDKFWNYNPTVKSWGDKAVDINPVLQFNQARFNNAETRARLAIYETFMNSGYTEAEAMEHVIATQFHYAGIGHVEDFMPFTQYSIYNALYWFDNADINALKTAWRAAQYNDDGSMTNQEIADMCSKYRATQYYLYERGVDEEYDRFMATNSDTIKHLISDGVDSYLGLPREFQSGALDLNGTHYIKLGNSFVEETDLILSLAAGAIMFSNGAKLVPEAEGAKENLRYMYDAIKYTPLYDKFYSPWKTLMDFSVYAYDAHQTDMQRSMKDKRGGIPTEVRERGTSFNIWDYYNDFVQDKSTHSMALSGFPLLGAVASNIVGRVKSFNLNLGELLTLTVDPSSSQSMMDHMKDYLCDVTGMIMPSLVGTRINTGITTEKRNAYTNYLNHIFAMDPTNYIDYVGRLQQMGFEPEDAQDILGFAQDMRDKFKTYGSNLDYIYAAKTLIDRGYTVDEVYNLFEQLQIKIPGEDKFLGMYNALPGYLKYDADARNQIIDYYMALGMSKTEAWTKLLTYPCTVEYGHLIELSPAQVALYNKKQRDAYNAVEKEYQFIPRTDEEWQAYWDSMPFRYPKGKWKETMNYLQGAGYSYAEAMKLCRAGYMINDKHDGLIDVQSVARTRMFSANRLSDAEFSAYWDTLPDYTKYEKGAFGRTMKALKAQGYDDATARALIQQGIYVDPNGIMMNVAGMERPVLGYKNFNEYYQTLPDFIKYEKGAFSRTYHVLKALGFDYDTSLRLIQQGAYLIDATGIPSMIAEFSRQNTMAMRQYKKNIKVHDVNTLLQKHGNTPIQGADGKVYLLINCSGLQRPRKKFSYSKRSYGGGGRRGGGGRSYSYGGGSSKKYSKAPRYSNWIMKKPFVTQGNVSTYNGFTNYRGSNKLTKPYTTKGYVSTYSLQNFLNGASYGMRKAYKIDMRQFKTGALSIKSAYPASYRNIAVAYRHNLYKDLYAKYGASRMMMRANKASYSNASIVRLRRNEIYNRERYAERRDQISKTKTQKKSTR